MFRIYLQWLLKKIFSYMEAGFAFKETNKPKKIAASAAPNSATNIRIDYVAVLWITWPHFLINRCTFLFFN